MKQLSQDVLTALSTAEIEGTNVKLTGQLDRKLYKQVNEVLEGSVANGTARQKPTCSVMIRPTK